MLRRPVHPILLGLIATYTLAGGYVHLKLWFDGYSRIPTSLPGWWVVRIGFVASAALAVLVATALLMAIRFRSIRAAAVMGAVGFAVGSLAVLIATRMGSVFGWSEPSWTPGANQVRAVAVGVIVLGVSALVGPLVVRRPVPAVAAAHVRP